MIEVSFCDEISEGQFGKINLIGWNPTGQIAVPQVPYRLFSTLVIRASFRPRESTADLSFSIKQTNPSGQVLFEETHPIANINRENPNESLWICFFQPLTWEIKTYGTVRIAVASAGNEVGADLLQVVQGPGPMSGLLKPIVSSGVLAKGEGYILSEIIGSATQSLVLIDRFLGSSSLMDLLTGVPAGIAIRVLTRPDLKAEYQQRNPDVRRMTGNLEVRFSDKIHDRYVIVNGTEYFHFGYSLKDLWRGKVSRYAKVYRKDEIQDLSDVIENEWTAATIL